MLIVNKATFSSELKALRTDLASHLQHAEAGPLRDAIVQEALWHLLGSFQEPVLESLTEESAHPYSANMNMMKKLQIAGAASIKLEFDSECLTESGCDYMEFWEDEGRETLIKKYSSREMCDQTIIVNQDHVWMSFHSDGSQQYWGWKIIVSENKIADTDLMSKPSIKVASWIMGLLLEAKVCLSPGLLSCALSVAVSTRTQSERVLLLKNLIAASKNKEIASLDWSAAVPDLENLMVQAKASKDVSEPFQSLLWCFDICCGALTSAVVL